MIAVRVTETIWVDRIVLVVKTVEVATERQVELREYLVRGS